MKYLLLIPFLLLIGCTNLDTHQKQVKIFSKKSLKCKNKSEPILLQYIRRQYAFFKINCEKEVYIIKCYDDLELNNDGSICSIISVIKLKNKKGK